MPLKITITSLSYYTFIKNVFVRYILLHNFLDPFFWLHIIFYIYSCIIIYSTNKGEAQEPAKSGIIFCQKKGTNNLKFKFKITCIQIDIARLRKRRKKEKKVSACVHDRKTEREIRFGEVCFCRFVVLCILRSRLTLLLV